MAEENKSCAFRTSIGGQALIEGILMRGPEKQAIVVRDQEGNLVEKVESLRFIKDRYPVLGLPLVRGTVNFLDSMVGGVKALMYSADFYPEEEAAKPSKFELWLEKHLSSKKLESAVVALAVALGVGMSVFLFMILPTLLTGAVLHFLPGFPLWGRNLVEGLLKVVIFMAYLILCSRQKDIYRVFQYHGAEHKTIFCYEAGLPLTVENVCAQPKHHPRCGTSFLFVVIVVSILLSSLVFSFIHVENTFARMGMHLLMLPLIVAITYEINRYVGGHEGAVCRLVRAPGMAIQRWTTFEPDDTMIEVGIKAFTEVLPQEAGADKW